MAKNKELIIPEIETENILLTGREMDIVFTALDRYQKEGTKVQNSADRIGIKDAAVAAQRFEATIDGLKQKFLRSV